MDYLETSVWWYPQMKTTPRRPKGTGRKFPERKTRGVRVCECGEKLSIYNPENSCFQCQEKATRRGR